MIILCDCSSFVTFRSFLVNQVFYVLKIIWKQIMLRERYNEIVGKQISFKLRKTGKIGTIPYRIYYNSCNLEHVLYEKEKMSDDFAEKYEGKVEEFIMFISQQSVAVPGTYKETWEYIEKELNSLNRHSNMHQIFSEP